MGLTRALFQITRPSSSLLTFLSVFVPVFVRTLDIGVSARRAVPLLLVSMCTFIANDLDDMEKDRVNHHERPLPSGQVSPGVAAAAYFLCLMLALLSTRYFVGTNRISFLYYALLATWTSYHYIVEYLPALKALYVAAVSVLPVLILIAYYPNEIALRSVAIALFLFMLGRELCKDLPDRAGDPQSRLHSISPIYVARFAFSIATIGLLLLGPLARDLITALILGAMGTALVVAYTCWFHWNRLITALRLMQTILFIGLYFLL